MKQSEERTARNGVDLHRLVRRVREYELDHEPNGWPAVDMSFLSEMADELEYWIGQAETQRKCKLAAHDRLDQAYDALFSSPNVEGMHK